MIDIRVVNKGRTYKIGPQKNITVAVEDILDALDKLQSFSFTQPWQAGQIHCVDDVNRVVNAMAHGKTCLIGTMFGVQLAVTSQGEFVFENGETHVPDQPSPIIDLDVCKHRGFVVRDIVGDFRFLCRECNKRFRRHPWAKSEVDEYMEKYRRELGSAMEDFRHGIMTLTNAVKQSQVSMRVFKEALKTYYPPKLILEPIQTIGQGTVGHAVVGAEPQRRSDPEEFETLIGNPKVSGADKTRVIREVFTDVTGYKRWEDMEKRYHVMVFDFVDSTKQRIEICDFDIAWARTELLNQQGIRVNLNYPLIFGGLS